MNMRTVVLASASPRRRELLQTHFSMPFTVRAPSVKETMPFGLSPAETVMELARVKAESLMAEGFADVLIIAADTIVCCDGEVLGKPRSEDDAARMLRLLSGRRHEVYTGLALLDRDGLLLEAEKTAVFFRDLSDDEIACYVRTGEPMDKAGAYGIQGKAALFVRRIEGDYYNVVGLPICRLGQMLNRKGVPVL